MTIQRLTVAALLLTLGGCDCGTSTRKLFPKIEVIDEMGNARTSVEFGQVQLNFTATKKVRIRNAGAAALTQVMSGLLYNISPFDPLTFVAVSCVLTLVALAAIYIPARRAMGVDPLVALRSQ